MSFKFTISGYGEGLNWHDFNQLNPTLEN